MGSECKSKTSQAQVPTDIQALDLALGAAMGANDLGFDGDNRRALSEARSVRSLYRQIIGRHVLVQLAC